MSDWETRLLTGLVIAALVNIGNWRAWLWLALGAADYVVTSAWYDLGWPMHPLFTAFVDASVCFAIYKICTEFGGERWELPLFTAFQFSVLGSFAMAAHMIAIDAYALWLEAANWLALLVTIGAGTARLVDVVVNFGGWRDRGAVHRALHSVSAPTRFDAWWWLRKAHARG